MLHHQPSAAAWNWNLETLVIVYLRYTYCHIRLRYVITM